MITFIDRTQHYANMHRAGWKYVIDSLQDAINDCKYDNLPNIIFDSVLDLSNNVYTEPWIGVIHHTFDTTFDNNCVSLFNKQSFLYSLKYCKALITLTNYLKDQIVEELYKRKIFNIPVYCIIHPTDFNCPKFTFKKYRNKVVQIGGWLRNPFSIYALQVGYNLKKYALKGPRMDHNFPEQQPIRPTYTYPEQWLSRPPLRHGNTPQGLYGLTHNTFYKFMEQYIGDCIKSVQIIEQLDNDEYDKLLSESIVFINVIDCSAVNTVIECIVRNTPIIVNRHPALEEVLGIDYPGFYSNMYQASLLVNSPLQLYKIYIFLCKMNKDHLRIETCINDFKKVIYELGQIDELDQRLDITEECSICMEPITSDFFITGCNHIFHELCMCEWITYNRHFPLCPICRSEISVR